VNPSTLILPGFIPHPNLQETQKHFLKDYTKELRYEFQPGKFLTGSRTLKKRNSRI